MFGISTLWNALSGLASAVVDLTSTVKDINGTLRQRLGLDQVEQVNPVQLPEPDAVVATNGRRRKLPSAAE